jgi:predicted DNA-binding transcriptional regulator YafY
MRVFLAPSNDIGVYRRTIRRDIDCLRGQLHAPIEFDCVRNGYNYTEPTYQLSFPQLTQGEILSLDVSEQMMREFRGTLFEREMRQAIAEMSAVVLDSLAGPLEPEPDLSRWHLKGNQRAISQKASVFRSARP